MINGKIMRKTSLVACSLALCFSITSGCSSFITELPLEYHPATRGLKTKDGGILTLDSSLNLTWRPSPKNFAQSWGLELEQRDSGVYVSAQYRTTGFIQVNDRIMAVWKCTLLSGESDLSVNKALCFDADFSCIVDSVDKRKIASLSDDQKYRQYQSRKLYSWINEGGQRVSKVSDLEGFALSSCRMAVAVERNQRILVGYIDVGKSKTLPIIATGGFRTPGLEAIAVSSLPEHAQPISVPKHLHMFLRVPKRSFASVRGKRPFDTIDLKSRAINLLLTELTGRNFTAENYTMEKNYTFILPSIGYHRHNNIRSESEIGPLGVIYHNHTDRSDPNEIGGTTYRSYSSIGRLIDWGTVNSDLGEFVIFSIGDDLAALDYLYHRTHGYSEFEELDPVWR